MVRRGGAEPARVQAVLVGGYHGAWVPGSALDTPLSVAGLRPHGATPGAGIVHLLDEPACPLDVAARVTAYLAVAERPPVRALPQRPAPHGRDDAPAGPSRRRSATCSPRLERLQALVNGRGACKHPDGTVRFVASTLRVFGAHVDRHLRGDCGKERR